MKTRFQHIVPALILSLASAAAVSGLALAAGHGAHDAGHAATGAGEETKQVYTTGGVIVSVDRAAKKAVITHEPIPALGWPTMTMGFAFDDASMPEGLKAGDRVRLDFRNQGNVSVILDIEVRN
jgi:Cu/Ag efflux protein CusF